MGMRVSARRRRKIQRTLRTARLITVSTQAPSRRSQNVRGASGADPRRAKTRSVATIPTTTTAPDMASSTTQTMARGGLATRVGTSAWRAAINSGAMVFPGRCGERGALADLADYVGRFVLRLVVGANEELRHETQRQQLHPGKHEQDAEHQQRTVADCLAHHELDERQVGHDEQPWNRHGETDQPEDLQRTRRVAEQELDRQEIENDADGSRNTVLRSAVHALAMIDRHLADQHALFARDGRDEPMHLAVQLDRFDDFRAKHLERAAVVAQLYTGGPRDQAIGEKRWQQTGDEGVLAVATPAAHDIELLVFELLHQPRNVRRIVLEIAVGRDDHPAARRRETGGEG